MAAQAVCCRFGRIQEGFSEDPELTSQLGVAAVNGLQQTPGQGPGTYLPSMAVAALAKHWCAPQLDIDCHVGSCALMDASEQALKPL